MNKDMESQLAAFARALQASLPEVDAADPSPTPVREVWPRRTTRPLLVAASVVAVVALIVLPQLLPSPPGPIDVPSTTTTQVPTTPPPIPPSQSRDDALRDGVVPELARVPFELRVDVLIEIPSDEGQWVLSRPTRELNESVAEVGAGSGIPKASMGWT